MFWSFITWTTNYNNNNRRLNTLLEAKLYAAPYAVKNWSVLLSFLHADQPCHAPKTIVDGKSVFAIATTTITFTIPLPLSLKSRVEWNFLARCVVMVKFRAIKIRYLLCDKRSKIGRFVAEILFILSREHASVLW